ncbi:MAG: hypothetical protein ACE5HE_03930 [Phycisphaerae bacterium]
MLGRPSDLGHIKENLLFFVGLRAERPRFGRFSYMEKCEYWALIWGGLIMTVTGVMLWFDDHFVQRWQLPKVLLDVALVIHYYEAWLATLAVLVWHGYSTVFSPHVYPMNPAWLSGKMPKEMYSNEHPAGPKLKAFILRELYEEEKEEEEEEGQGEESRGVGIRSGGRQPVTAGGAKNTRSRVGTGMHDV